MPRTVVIGGGISGLVCGYRLMQRGDDVVILESQSAGGVIHTERSSGYLLEYGPNTLRNANAELRALINDLDLAERMQIANGANVRSVILNGALASLPRSPLQAITTPLLSPTAKLRLLCEPFVGRTKSDDESVASFMRRRLGKSITEQLVDPFVSGIYAGDIDRLSIRETFPTLWRSEREHGSIAKSFLRRPRKASARDDKTKSRPQIFSFTDGMGELVRSLRTALAGRLQHAEARSIERTNAGFQLTIQPANTIETERVIVATPAYAAATILQNLSPTLSTTLASIEYAPIASLYLGFRREQFSRAPNGFGFLVPSKERLPFLGCIFSSSMFPNRAPEGHVLLTLMIGGAKHPELVQSNAEKLAALVLPELQSLLSISGEPEFVASHAFERAIPQYRIGYGNILSRIREFKAANASLHILGNYVGGVSVADCVRNATELAARLVTEA